MALPSLTMEMPSLTFARVPIATARAGVVSGFSDGGEALQHEARSIPRARRRSNRARSNAINDPSRQFMSHPFSRDLPVGSRNGANRKLLFCVDPSAAHHVTLVSTM